MSGLDDATVAGLRASPTAEALADARRYAAHLEAQIAEARKLWDEHGRSVSRALFGSDVPGAEGCVCTACRIAAVFGWDAP